MDVRVTKQSRWEVMLHGSRWLLGIGGVVLLTAAAAGTLRGYVLSGRDMRAFERARMSGPALPVRALESLPAPDTGDWSARRIRAYQEAGADPSVPLALLRIPSLDLTAPVRDGTDELTLNRGLGWIGGTSRPGKSGNTGIAGHRDGFFRELRRIETGDVVELVTLDAIHRYEVEKRWIVSPEDVDVLASNGSPEITLVTCYPFYYLGSAPERFIVRGRYLGSEPSKG